MVAKSSILHNLTLLSSMYMRASTPKVALFCAKAAVLELCGWIEESMDEIIRRATKSLKIPANTVFVTNDIIKKTYGFDYDYNFRIMLIKAIGIRNVERLEGRVGSTDVDAFKSVLNTLKAIRNTEAHTHLKGVAKVLDAPSVTISRFHQVLRGLKSYEAAVRKLKF